MVVDVLLVSDLHIGRKTSTYNVYRSKVRMGKMAKNAYKVGKSSGAEQLAICLLGDIVDGEEVYAGQGYEVDSSVDVMMDLAVDQLEKLYDLMGKVYNRIRLYCVYGNHGRANRRSSETANWDLVVYQRLQDRLGDDVVKISKRFWMIPQIAGHKVLLFHGDNIRMYHQIPYYGIIQRVLRFNSTAGYRCDIACLGHFHHLFYFQYNDIHIFGNGTMLTDDDYSLKSGLTPSNAFWMFGLSDEQNIIWQIPVKVC